MNILLPSRNPPRLSRRAAFFASFLLCIAGCGGSSDQPGGTGGTGGAGTGGQGSGGVTSSGGAVGAGSGGSATGGSTTGATGSGGSATGGSATGGAPSGGTASGGSGSAGRSGAGSGGTNGSASGGTTGSAGSSGAAGRGGRGSAGRMGAGGGALGTGGAGTAGSSGTGGMGSTTPGMSAGCGKAPTIASSMYNNGTRIPIMAANMQRRYILNVPTDYDNTKPYRLIIAFHQLNGNDVQMYNNKYYHLMNLDTGHTTIFVAPNGQSGGAPCSGTGNGESGCGWPNGSNADVALADAVVQQVEENFCVDTNRIFANGWSYGGAMSYETACARPAGAAMGYLRAIAVYSGSPQISQGPCPPTHPVAYYASHGTQD
ncbi:MAG TPA: hypothetical protein VIU64_04385, partial [Polyangia bacterium]